MRSRGGAAKLRESRRGGAETVYELTHAHWAASAPPPSSGFLSSSTALPEVQPPSRPPAATPCGRPRPLPAPPPSSPPPPLVVAPACSPGRGGFGAASRERGVVPGAAARL